MLAYRNLLRRGARELRCIGKAFPFSCPFPVCLYVLNSYGAEVATGAGLVFLPGDSTVIGITTSAQPNTLRKSLHKTSAQGIELSEVCN